MIAAVVVFHVFYLFKKERKPSVPRRLEDLSNCLLLMFNVDLKNYISLRATKQPTLRRKKTRKSKKKGGKPKDCQKKKST